MGAKFRDYVEDVEARNTPEQQERLDQFRAQYRRANDLLERRKALGMSQAELARRSGVAQADISRLERGQGNPTERTMHALAAELGVDYRLVDAGAGGPEQPTS